MGTTTDDGDEAGVDNRQVLLVALCLFGLVTASFLAPVTGTNPPVGGGDGGLLSDAISELAEFLTTGREPGDGGGGDGGGGGGGGDGVGIPEWLIELFRDLFDDGDDDDDNDDDGGGGGGGGGSGEADCQVYVESDPSPGSETTVRVLNEGEPQSGVRVWFNDQYVGETDADGEVTGEVPYVDELNVTVQSDDTCAFSRQPSVGSGSSLSVPTAAVGGPLQSVVATDVPVGALLAGDTVAQADDGVNSSSEVQVDGDATVTVVGDPYPNATVEVVARVGGTPIPDANVSVDGERVGRTDGSGRYTLSVPDRDRISVTVSRGAVSGTTTINVLQLQIRVVPQFVVPGETVTANVTTPAGPVSGAELTLDGRQVGTTGEDGRIQFGAPAAVDGTITAATSRQSTTVPLWKIYAVTGGMSALLVVVATLSTAVTARRSGRERAKRVAVGWAIVAGLFVAYAVWELVGLLAGLALIAVLALYVFREWVLDLLVWLAAAAERVLWWCQRAVLGIVSLLETVVDTVRIQSVRFVAWLRRQPRSLSGLLANLRDWLADFPEHLRAAAGSTAGRVVAAAVAALLFVVVSTLLLGLVGFLLSSALVVAVAVGWLVKWYLDDGESASDTPTETPAEAMSRQPLGADISRPSLRELWRRVAQWVLPASWRTRTPAEISRAAIDAGLPREPVERLADAFREVEYGGGSETAHLDEAWQAYESLETEREDDG